VANGALNGGVPLLTLSSGVVVVAHNGVPLVTKIGAPLIACILVVYLGETHNRRKPAENRGRRDLKEEKNFVNHLRDLRPLDHSSTIIPLVLRETDRQTFTLLRSGFETLFLLWFVLF
jgi:hypothetical protein